MLQKVCLRGKEPFSLTDTVIVTAWRIFCYLQGCQPKLKKVLKSQDFSISILRTGLAENPLKFPSDTYNSPKSIEVSPKI
jgi:hypothetical protein